jgi:hypothetical protein
MRASARSSGNASIDRAIEQLELLDQPVFACAFCRILRRRVTRCAAIERVQALEMQSADANGSVVGFA